MGNGRERTREWFLYSWRHSYIPLRPLVCRKENVALFLRVDTNSVSFAADCRKISFNVDSMCMYNNIHVVR